MAGMKLIVGLGNPGEEYAETRHNAGFKVIERLAGELKIDLSRNRFGGSIGQGDFEDKKLILLKPQKFMNRSGEVVAKAMGFYKFALGDLLVVTDDMDLEPGRIRVRAKGSAGGHNGLADIIEKLGSNQFGRLRVGIGGCDGIGRRDYVLSRPDKQDRELINQAVEKAAKAVICWIKYGVVKAMNEFNRL
jgi:PTH1 family peptidyl-tRNA hydrolase